jgi:hypothetical protein
VIGKHVNLSPKGYTSSTFSILSPNRAVYLDATGSGVETIAHLYENKRITVMFCSFDSAPRILRLFCTGQVAEIGSELYESMTRQMKEANTDAYKRLGIKDEYPKMTLKEARAVIVLHVWKVQTSCGFGVPMVVSSGSVRQLSKHEQMNKSDVAGVEDVTGKHDLFVERDTLARLSVKMEKDKVVEKRRQKWNPKSLDKLPGLTIARRDNGEWILLGDLMAKVTRIAAQWDAILVGVTLTALLSWLFW